MSSAMIELALLLEEAIHDLSAIKRIPASVRRAETKLTKGLQGVMADAFDQVILELGKKKGLTINEFDMNHFRAMMTEKEPELEKILRDAVEINEMTGRKLVLDDLKDTKIKIDNLDVKTRNRIKRMALGTSERITNNGAKAVYESLAQSHTEGLGIDDAKERLREHLKDYSDNELSTVARTEINGAQNVGSYNTMRELSVEYHQWWTGDDDRVRGTNPDDKHDHVVMHGQITKVGELFSNGLYHPGDRGGPIGQWINCRCRTVPYMIPEGMRPPKGAIYFYPDELEPVDKKEERSALDEERVAEFKEEQKNRSPEEKYKAAKEYVDELEAEANREGMSLPEYMEGKNFKLEDHNEAHYKDILMVDEDAIPGVDNSGIIDMRTEGKKASREIGHVLRGIDPELTEGMDPLAYISMNDHGIRASYNPMMKRIRVTPGDARAIQHEFGHHIHNQSDRVASAVSEFFKERIAGEKLETIYAGTTEVGYRDKFVSHYMGRIYDGLDGNGIDSSVRGEEIMAMGIERMRNTTRARAFYRDDPGYYKFMTAVMRGLI